MTHPLVINNETMEEVASKFTDLKPSGDLLLGCCPFHKEDTPSFFVNPASQTFHCFGCGESGNLDDFLLKTNPNVIKPNSELKKAILQANRDAADYFHSNLVNTRSKCATYCRNRGISKESIETFNLGYAPVDGSIFTKHMQSLGHDTDLLIAAGLVSKSGKHRCSFFNRLMFPISDKDGNIVGFGGRALVDNGDSKYINTADTELFSKRGELFAFHIAKHYARDFLIVCEGYMDALSMHQAGIKQAVASMGTAFTPEHAELIKRYTDTVVVAQDSDKAGNESAEKMARVLAKYNIRTVRLSTRPYKDPDEFIKNEGGDAFKERIRQAIANKYNEYQLLTDR